MVKTGIVVGAVALLGVSGAAAVANQPVSLPTRPVVDSRVLNLAGDDDTVICEACGEEVSWFDVREHVENCPGRC